MKKKTTKKKDKIYSIKCPKCETTFDCSNEITKWIFQLKEMKEVLNKLEQLINKKSEEISILKRDFMTKY